MAAESVGAEAERVTRRVEGHSNGRARLVPVLGRAENEYCGLGDVRRVTTAMRRLSRAGRGLLVVSVGLSA